MVDIVVTAIDKFTENSEVRGGGVGGRLGTGPYDESGVGAMSMSDDDVIPPPLTSLLPFEPSVEGCSIGEGRLGP